MPDEQPTPDRAAEEARDDWLILDLLLEEGTHRPWASAEIAREYGHELNAIDAIDRLHGAGLAHKTSDGFVFATRAAVRYHEIVDQASSPRTSPASA
jgi:hypothetical protein